MGVADVGVTGVFKNLGKVAKNKTVSMFQDPDQLKTDSLILASLVLVVSRILVANLSAIKTMGTSEGPFRYKQAVQTDIREICGWTFGFIVLRQIQNWLKKKLAGPMGIRKIGEPPSYSLWKNLVKSFTKQGPEALQLNLATAQKLEYNAAAASPKWRDFLTKSPLVKPLFSKLGKTEADCMKMLYRAAPIALGSIPAVFLAGYALERFTRDYSDHVVDVVSKTFKNSKAAQMSAGANPEAKPQTQASPNPTTLNINSTAQAAPQPTVFPFQQSLGQPLGTAPSFAGLKQPMPLRSAMPHRGYYSASLPL